MRKRWFREPSGHYETDAARDLRWLLDDLRERYARWLAEHRRPLSRSLVVDTAGSEIISDAAGWRLFARGDL